MVHPYFLEACVTTVGEALHAAQHGAHRLELCVRLETEGMSPHPDLLQTVLEAVHLPVRVMIRETETGYEADDFILKNMVRRIQSLLPLRPDGFVLGVLKHNTIDKTSMKELLTCCHPLPVTFHKALDATADPPDEIEWLNGQPQIDTLLTSGGAARALEGIEQILMLKEKFRGDVMGAGKITPDVLPRLHAQLDLRWYHGRAIV